MSLALDHLSNYMVDANGCWNFLGFKYAKGYGKAGRHGYAHRYFYREFVGPIPDGMEIDHLCTNRGCVNPQHLEPVSHAENVRRTWERNPRTHCPNGHEYTAENMVAGGGKRCKTCMRDRARTRRSRAVAS